MNADGSDQRRAHPRQLLGRPQWSPDARRVVFSRSRGTERSACRQRGRDRTRQPRAMAPSSQAPSWSPDGTKIVTLAGSGESDIWIMNPDGTGAVPILDDALIRSGPRWQPIPRAPTARDSALRPTSHPCRRSSTGRSTRRSCIRRRTFFEYGMTAAYGTGTPTRRPLAGRAPGGVGRPSATCGRAPPTTCGGRAQRNGTTAGADATFQTPKATPRSLTGPRHAAARSKAALPVRHQRTPPATNRRVRRRGLPRPRHGSDQAREAQGPGHKPGEALEVVPIPQGHLVQVHAPTPSIQGKAQGDDRFPRRRPAVNQARRTEVGPFRRVVRRTTRRVRGWRHAHGAPVRAAAARAVAADPHRRGPRGRTPREARGSLSGLVLAPGAAAACAGPAHGCALPRRVATDGRARDRQARREPIHPGFAKTVEGTAAAWRATAWSLGPSRPACRPGWTAYRGRGSTGWSSWIRNRVDPRRPRGHDRRLDRCAAHGEESGLALSQSQVLTAGSIYVAGACLGALFFGQLTDRFGRKRLFLLTLFVYLIATVATAFAESALYFYACRFVTGAGIGGEYAAINSAIDELIPARVRGRVDLIINGSYWLGAAGGAVAAIFLLDTSLFAADLGWRLAFGLGAVFALAILLVRRHVPESPRWLFIHGREDEAERIVEGIENDVRESTGEELEEPGDSITVRQRKTISFKTIASVAFKRFRSGPRSALRSSSARPLSTTRSPSAWAPSSSSSTASAIRRFRSTSCSSR